MADNKVIYLAGGCFWGLEKYLKLINGVTDTEVGFVNGNSSGPVTYEQVYTDTTGYAECVKVEYNPEILPLKKLLDFYFMAIDPTLENRQGHDIGTRYRSGIFYSEKATDQDKKLIEASVREIAERYGKIYVETGRMITYYPAEEYHQDYLEKNPGGYCHIRPELYAYVISHNQKQTPKNITPKNSHQNRDERT